MQIDIRKLLLGMPTHCTVTLDTHLGAALSSFTHMSPASTEKSEQAQAEYINSSYPCLVPCS